VPVTAPHRLACVTASGNTRRLGTSVPQLYRLLDPTNARKTINQLVSLLHVLDCDVELIVKEKSAA
jgi:hypothetical protein